MTFIEDIKWLDTIYQEYPDKFVWTGLYMVYMDNDGIGWPIQGTMPDHVMDELNLLYKKMLNKYTED